MSNDNCNRIKVVYRPDGCVDFLTTKAVHEGTALTPDELAELDLSYSSAALDVLEDDFWSDSCFSEPLFSAEGKKLSVRTDELLIGD